MSEFVLLLVHVLSAAVLFGTGLGIAFFMVRAHRSGDPAIVAAVSRMVVAAYLVSPPPPVVQPVTGVLLALARGWPGERGCCDYGPLR